MPTENVEWALKPIEILVSMPLSEEEEEEEEDHYWRNVLYHSHFTRRTVKGVTLSLAVYEGIRGSENRPTASSFLKLDTRWKWVVRFKPRLLYPRYSSACYRSTQDDMDTNNVLDYVENRRFPFHCWESNQNASVFQPVAYALYLSFRKVHPLLCPVNITPRYRTNIILYFSFSAVDRNGCTPINLMTKSTNSPSDKY